MKRRIVTLSFALALGGVTAIVGFGQFRLDALQEPGHIEKILATRAKRVLIRRSSREGIPPGPTNLQASIEHGDKLCGKECAACHGDDGNRLTDAGRWMYPHAADLTTLDVQEYSDRELCGMPAFGKVESDEHIWNLIHYVRTLRASPDNPAHPWTDGGMVCLSKTRAK